MDMQQNVREITLEAVVANIRILTAWIDEQLERLSCPLKARMQIDVAIDEIFTNIASYAYSRGSGDVTVRFSLEDRVVSVALIDSGIPFNPLAHPDPDVSLSAAERQPGGLGIFLVRKTMDDVQYRYEDGRNILTIRKKIGP